MTPGRARQTRVQFPRHAPAYLRKAKEFLEAAQHALAGDDRSAATGNAIHAGISASDAISCALTGQVSKGPHEDAVAHLEGIGSGGKVAARLLAQLLSLKTRAEYDPLPVQVADARKAITAAERIVAIAESTVAAASPY